MASNLKLQTFLFELNCILSLKVKENISYNSWCLDRVLNSPGAYYNTEADFYRNGGIGLLNIQDPRIGE